MPIAGDVGLVRARVCTQSTGSPTHPPTHPHQGDDDALMAALANLQLRTAAQDKPPPVAEDAEVKADFREAVSVLSLAM